MCILEQFWNVPRYINVLQHIFRERGFASTQAYLVETSTNYEVYHYAGTRLGNSSTFIFGGGAPVVPLFSYPNVRSLMHSG